jgi:hypothetical protein
LQGYSQSSSGLFTLSHGRQRQTGNVTGILSNDDSSKPTSSEPDLKTAQYRDKFRSHLDFVEDNSSSMNRGFADNPTSPMSFGNVPPQQQVYDDSQYKSQVSSGKIGPIRAFSPPLNQHTMPGQQPPRASSTPPVHNLAFNSAQADTLDYMNGDPTSLARQFSDLDMNVSGLLQFIFFLCGNTTVFNRLTTNQIHSE